MNATTNLPPTISSHAVAFTLFCVAAALLPFCIGCGNSAGLDASQRSDPDARQDATADDFANALERQAGNEPFRNNRVALRMQLTLLREGLRRMHRFPGYTATLQLQERLGGELNDEQTVRLKFRNEPFGVHMHWPETGREAAYVTGQNDGRLLVRPDGFLRVLGTLRLELDDPRVTRGSRFPVDQSGVLLLAERLLRERQADLRNPGDAYCRRLPAAAVDGRPCFRFESRYDTLRWNPPYRRLIAYIDKQSLLPIRIEHYAGSGGETLLGRYTYREIRFDRRLGESDFRIGGR